MGNRKGQRDSEGEKKRLIGENGDRKEDEGTQESNKAGGNDSGRMEKKSELRQRG